MELVEIDGPVVYLRLQGACGSCPSSLTTMTMGIKRRLQEKIPVRSGGSSILGSSVMLCGPGMLKRLPLLQQDGCLVEVAQLGLLVHQSILVLTSGIEVRLLSVRRCHLFGLC